MERLVRRGFTRFRCRSFLKTSVLARLNAPSFLKTMDGPHAKRGQRGALPHSGSTRGKERLRVTIAPTLQLPRAGTELLGLRTIAPARLGDLGESEERRDVMCAAQAMPLFAWVCQKVMVSTHRVVNEPLRKREGGTGHTIHFRSAAPRLHQRRLGGSPAGRLGAT